MCSRRFLSGVLVCGLVCAQEYYEELHMPRYGTKLSDIPKKFEIRGSNAKSEFDNYAKQIQSLVQHENATVLYRIKVDILKPPKKLTRRFQKKDKSKKYRVPLKKNSMKLSNFEVFLRKMAVDSNNNSPKHEVYSPPSTPKQNVVPTKQYRTKYKPIISKLNNFSKVIKPVKNRIITLTK